MIVTVVGLVLIGGSMALDLKNRGFANKIIGVDDNINHSNIAVLSKIVDQVSNLPDAINKSDLIIIATPISATKTLLPKILDQIKGTIKVVTDVGSTKAGIGNIVKNHSNRKQYVASHPMAGTEFS